MEKEDDFRWVLKIDIYSNIITKQEHALAFFSEKFSNFRGKCMHERAFWRKPQMCKKSVVSKENYSMRWSRKLEKGFTGNGV